MGERPSEGVAGSTPPPVSDLDELIRSMEPHRREGEFVFVDADSLPAIVTIEASVREDEGPSMVIARRDADRMGLAYGFVAAWITLRVHSALDAVGLTAAVSSALADGGISCNMIAGLRHDHALVPVDRADDALAILRRLAAAHPGSDPARIG